jgi:hypothetical protein
VSGQSAASDRGVGATFTECRWATPLVLAVAAARGPLLLSSGPHLYDAGELAAACLTLGASHPPGQPLHALLGHVLTRLPLGPISARIALLSLACALVAAGLAARLSEELALALGARANAARLGGAAAALALLLASPVLRQALRIEVYALALALTLWSALHLLRWARGRGIGHLWRAAFIAGLAAAVHPPHALAAVLAGVGLAATRPASLRRPLVSLLGAGLCCLLGLCAYAYLPLRAAAGAPMWGDPRSLANFIAYVSARVYRQNMFADGALSLPINAVQYGRYLLAHGAALPVVGAVSAWLLSPRARRSELGGVALGASLAVLASCIQPLEVRNPDNVAYLAPALCLWLVAGGAAYAVLLGTRAHWAAALALSALALQPATSGRMSEALHADLPALDTLAGSLLETPPPRSLVVATTDFTAGAWMMARAEEAARPDAALFIAGLSNSSWQWAQLAGHPAFDGRPVRGAGRNPHEQYLHGAIARALPLVPIALEREVQGVPVAALTGPYVLVRRDTAPTQAGSAPQSIGERLAGTVDRDAVHSPQGDYGAAAAIVRDYQARRAVRLLGLGRTPQALAELSASLWSLPAAQRLLRARPVTAMRELPPAVKDPAAFLLSLEDAVRLASTVLWALGRDDDARALLRGQSERGDARALLQLAWLQAFSGTPQAARQSLHAFVMAAPQLVPEARSLTARLSP